MGQGFVKFIKIDNETALGLNSNKNHKRALFIYTYLLCFEMGRRAFQFDLAKIIELLNLKVATSSKKSVKESLEELVSVGLISLYTDSTLSVRVDLELYIKKPKDTFWVSVNETTSENYYTLIPVSTIEDIVFSTGKEKPEDMLTVLAYVCAKTERREGVSPVMWVGMNKMAKDIHMSESKLKSVLDELLESKVLYFRRANMTGKRKNYIYGLYSDKESVDNAVLIAESNNVIDKRLKLTDMTDNIIDIIDGDCAIDTSLSNFFDRHKVECNEGVVNETNKFYRKHGRKRLLETLGEHNSEIHTADNKNGAYRGILRRSY